MVDIDLKEHASTEHELSPAHRDALLREANKLNLTIQPLAGAGGSHRITAGSMVGAVEVGDLSVLIEPKIGIPQLLSLACYATGVFKSQDTAFEFEEEEALPDVLAIALASAARRAFVGGLLHGYRSEEDALPTVRGRIRLEEQMRRRFGVGLPVEVRYDEFTDDILENRLVKAAASRLGRMRLRSVKARRDLSWVAGMLEQVSLVEFGPGAVPETRFDPLKEHYRGVVGLARLILRHSEFESGRGDVGAAGFLMDMNRLFQDFLTAALREQLRAPPDTLRSEHETALDEAGRARLKPDLSWWDGGTCRFVGDAKYKSLAGDGKGVPGADLYQLLAYATALDLPGGLLVYAQGEADAASYAVRHSDKRLDVVALDLSGTLDEALERVRCVAERVRAMRDTARRASLAA